MDLKGKLARLEVPKAGAAMVPSGAVLGDRSERLERLRARLDQMTRGGGTRPTRVERYRPPPPPEPTNLPGARRETPHGALYAVDRRYDWEHQHGAPPLAGALDATPRAIAELALDPALAHADPRGALFLDTETTGLAAGTGTLAFLIGMGWFEDGAFRVEQLVLTRPGNEAPMLRRLAERLERATALVSYNGKTFDWPLLKNRFVMNRVPLPPAPPHLDLLHCARRVFKFRLDSVRLVEVEREVLGFLREDDVDGGDIPQLYWSFLSSGDGAILGPILDHNANDIIALAAILGVLASGVEQTGDNDDPHDRLGFAHVAERNRDLTRALAFARSAADADVSSKGLCYLADLERRAGDPNAAVRALERALLKRDTSARSAAAIHLTLAKLHEHRLGNLTRALEHAKQTLRVEGKEKRARRVARIRRRIKIQREKAKPEKKREKARRRSWRGRRPGSGSRRCS